MKTIVFVLYVGVCLGCLVSPSPVSGQSSVVTVQLPSTNVMSGDSFEIPVIINGDANPLGACVIPICYDTNVLRLTSIQPGTNAFEIFLSNTNFPSSADCRTAGLDGAGIALAKNADSLVSPTGVVVAARFGFVAIGTPGSTSELVLPLDVPVPSGMTVVNTDAIELPLSLVNGLVTILGDQDNDGDGVDDATDVCPNTSDGAVVDADGCSIDQLVPCSRPSSSTGWKNHGAYVSTVARKAEDFLAASLITAAQKDAIVSAAAKSDCGKKSRGVRPRN